MYRLQYFRTLIVLTCKFKPLVVKVAGGPGFESRKVLQTLLLALASTELRKARKSIGPEVKW